MESLDKQMGSSSGQLNAEIKGYIVTISKWGKFLSILGFIGIGLMVIAALFMGSMVASLSNIPEGVSSGTMITVVYLIIAVVYFFPVLYLYKASTNLGAGIDSGSEESLTEGFKNLKSHYKFIGIFAIVILSIYVLAAIFGLMAAAMM